MDGNMISPAVAVDPGESTGLAWTDEYGRYETTVAPSKREVYKLLLALRPNTIVLEVFQTGQRLNAHSRYTIELCGGIEAIAEVLGARVIKHTPKAREGMLDWAEAELVKRWGPRGSVGHSDGVFTSHQIDALAHYRVWEETRR
jgi:hypothetical protein